jgi:hypothetical protein
MLLITLVIFAVNVIFLFIGVPFSNLGVRVIFQALGLIVGLFLALGLIRASLAVTRGQTPEVGMLLQPDHIGTYFLASILFALPFFVASLLGLVSPILTVIVDIALIAFAVTYGFYGFVIVDKGEESPIEALKQSAEITSGRRWPLFGLGILLALINVVGFCALCVGLLFTYGITIVAWAYAYRSLSNEPVAPV